MIPEANLVHLRNYNFHSVAPTPLDRLLSRIWWTPIADALPRWLSPNVITLMGACCMFAINYCLFTYIHKLDYYNAPDWVPLFIALMLLLYLTFDGIDGKQARRLGVSSPLGQLMDHGVDALVSVFYVYMCFTLFPGGFNMTVMLLLAVAPLHVLGTVWRESEFYTFSSTSGVVGVTETNLMTMLLQLLNYFCDAKDFNRVLYKVPRKMKYTLLGKMTPGYIDVFMLIQFAMLFMAYVEGLWGVFGILKDSRKRLGYLWFITSAALQTHLAAYFAYTVPADCKVLACLFASTVGGIICVTNIVRLICKGKLRRFHCELLPYHLLMLYFFGVPFLKSHRYDVRKLVLPHKTFRQALLGVTVYGFCYTFFVFAKTSHEILTYLRIPFFTVPSKPGRL